MKARVFAHACSHQLYYADFNPLIMSIQYGRTSASVFISRRSPYLTFSFVAQSRIKRLMPILVILIWSVVATDNHMQACISIVIKFMHDQM